MKKFDTMGRIGQLRKPEQERTGRRNRNGPESGTGTDRKAEQEPEWAGNRSMKRQKYRKRIAYNERLRKCKER